MFGCRHGSPGHKGSRDRAQFSGSLLTNQMSVFVLEDIKVGDSRINVAELKTRLTTDAV